MAKGKSSKKNSKTFFTIVVASTSALALILLTTILVQKPTNTQSNASANISAPTSPIEAEIRYDTNGDGNYQKSDDCATPNNYTFLLTYASASDGNNRYTTKNVECITRLQPLDRNNGHKYNIELQGSDKLSYMYIVYKIRGDLQITQVDPKHTWPIDQASDRNVKVVYGLKKAAAINNPGGGDNTDLSNNCKPELNYSGPSNDTTSVTYSFSITNNCKTENKKYLVWAEIDDKTNNGKSTKGVTWKFTNGAESTPITKTIDSGDTAKASVKVDRSGSDALKKGSSNFKVYFYAAPCPQSECNSKDDANMSRKSSFWKTYNVTN